MRPGQAMAVKIPSAIPPKRPATLLEGDILRRKRRGAEMGLEAVAVDGEDGMSLLSRPTIRAPVSQFHTMKRRYIVCEKDWEERCTQ